MLDLDAALPPGALCEAHPDAVAAALGEAYWWHGREDAMDTDPATGAITRWTPHGTGPAAIPTEPNKGLGQSAEIGGLFGLQCRAGTHCGMVAEGVTKAARTATMAIRFYTPPGDEARTLLTLNAAEGGNYLFLSEAAETLTVKDDNDLIEVDLPCPATETPRLLIVSLHGDQLAVSLDGTRRKAQARAPVLTGPASLFIGCRNHRPKLFKTLGAALILDVWLFPGRALLMSDGAADTTSLAALARHHLWAEG